MTGLKIGQNYQIWQLWFLKITSNGIEKELSCSVLLLLFFEVSSANSIGIMSFLLLFYIFYFILILLGQQIIQDHLNSLMGFFGRFVFTWGKRASPLLIYTNALVLTKWQHMAWFVVMTLKVRSFTWQPLEFCDPWSLRFAILKSHPFTHSSRFNFLS